MTTPTLSYEPPPHELAYYEELFALADPSHVGHIQGREAVAFLARSKLPMELLKGIWGMVDTNPTTNSLDKNKFFAVVRLIQLSQNGKTAAGPNLLVSDGETSSMHTPYFDGITGVVIPPFTTDMHATSAPVATRVPTPSMSPVRGPVTHHHTQALAVADPYMMQPGDQSKYESLFPQFEKEGFVYGQAAVALFSKSGLDNDTLRDIWNMVDNPVDNRLSKLEFAIAMHLIVCISKKNLPMPTTLPPSLEALKKAEVATLHHPPTAPLTPAPVMPHLTGGGPPSPTRSSGRVLSIGEAFEDLNPQPNPTYMPQLQLSSTSTGETAGSAGSSTMTMPPAVTNPSPIPSSTATYTMGTTPMVDTGLMVPSLTTSSFSHRQDIPVTYSTHTHETHSSGSPSSIPPTLTTTGAKGKITEAGYSMESSMAEVIQLRSILQTLQAENIALKAQVGQFSDEEKQIRSEITLTSTEIVTLIQELTGLRNRVAEARIQLLEATAELKVLTDKKEALQDLLKQEQSTLTSTQEAMENVHGVLESLQLRKMQDQQPPVTTQNPHPTMVEHNFLDLDSFVQVNPQTLPPLAPPSSSYSSQPFQMEPPHDVDVPPPSSDFIVYPVPEIPEYHPGMLMGGTSTGSVNRMGTGSVDLSAGGEYSIASTAEYPYGGALASSSAASYYWNPEELHGEDVSAATAAVVGEDHAETVVETEKHSKDSKKWGGFLRKGGGGSGKQSTKSVSTI